MTHEIETYSGKFLDYEHPRASDIDIGDIARGLAFQPRFMGQTKFFYSVAQHSRLVAKIMADLGGTVSQSYAGLFHDAHEAYIGDCPSPLKRVYGNMYEAVRAPLDEAITRRFGFSPEAFQDPLVKLADAVALRAEAHMLKTTGGRDHRWDRVWAPDALAADWPNYCEVVAPCDMAEVEQAFLRDATLFDWMVGTYAPTSAGSPT